MAMFQGRGSAPGFGAPPPWNARPGEQAVGGGAGGGRGGAGVAAAGAPAGATPGAAAGAAAAAPAAAAMPDPSMFQQMVALFAIPGRASGGGFGLEFLQTLGFGNAGFAAFGGGGAGVASGDYVVVLNVGGKTLRQKIRVERPMP